MKPFVSAKKKSRKQKSPAVKAGLFWMEQMMGIEPTQPAWEAGVLPLNYICTESAIMEQDSVYSMVP